MSKKTFTKRIRITKNGKMMRRKMGQGHNRSKRTSTQANNKKGSFSTSPRDMKAFTQYLSRFSKKI